jgi:uncharacterized protein YndB with AHSA1/START domain
MTAEGELVVERFVSVAPSVVFGYFIDGEKWTAWQGTEAEVDLRPGGIWRVNVTGDGWASGHVEEVVADERIVFTWGWERSESPVPPGSTRVAIDLIPQDDGTLIRLTHSDLPLDQIEVHRMGWDFYSTRLAAAAEGRDPGPNRFPEPG